MPFTPAHPAIILPLLKRRFFSATGLIAGSMSPDFEYFFKAKVRGVHGHTIPGLLYFDLPVCLLIAFVFHSLIKSSFIPNLPAFLQRRFESTLVFDFKEYFRSNYHIFIFSALVGASSHILWDGFTHNGTFFVNHLPMYEGSYIPFQGAKYPLWYALQHVSTFTGLTIMVIYIVLLPGNDTVDVKTPSALYWMSLILLALLFFIARFSLFEIYFSLGNAVVTSISSILLSTCIISVIVMFRLRGKKPNNG